MPRLWCVRSPLRTAPTENLVAVQLCRLYGREQVSYSLSGDATREREVAPLRQFAAKHPDWQLLIITYDEATIVLPDTPIAVQPVWLMAAR